MTRSFCCHQCVLVCVVVVVVGHQLRDRLGNDSVHCVHEVCGTWNSLSSWMHSDRGQGKWRLLNHSLHPYFSIMLGLVGSKRGRVSRWRPFYDRLILKWRPCGAYNISLPIYWIPSRHFFAYWIDRLLFLFPSSFESWRCRSCLIFPVLCGSCLTRRVPLNRRVFLVPHKNVSLSLFFSFSSW